MSDIYEFLDNNLYRTTPTSDSKNVSQIPTVQSDTTGTVYADQLLTGELDGVVTLTGGSLQSKNYVSGSAGWRLTPTSGEFNFAVSVDSIDIPDTTTANSFHVDVDGNTWWGATTLGTSIASVTKAGVATFVSGTIGGFSLGADYIRDAANSFGMASTVTGGDDVRFWAGDTYANRATAPFRVTESGVVTAESITIDGYSVVSQGTFGGDGSDGALAITSGTTTISAASSSTLVKNYTSISITSTGVLAFSNPHGNGTFITLKSQGGVTLTSTSPAIDTRGMGAAGGASSSAANGSNANGRVFTTTNQCGIGNSTLYSAAGGGSIDNPLFYTSSAETPARRYIAILCGAGGGSSGGGGAGGNGGGALLIECAGALNFTGTINTSGNNGSVGTSGGINRGNGGGGGGSAGMVVILYNTLTSAAGTITATGGTGGTGGNGGAIASVGSGGAGGAGSLNFSGGDGSQIEANGVDAGGLGAGGGGGGGGSTTSGDGIGAPGGAGGASMGGLIAKNVYFG